MKSVVICLLLVSCSVSPILVQVDRDQSVGVPGALYAVGSKTVEDLCGWGRYGCELILGKSQRIFIYIEGCDVCRQHEQDHIEFGPKHRKI